MKGKVELFQEQKTWVVELDGKTYMVQEIYWSEQDLSEFKVFDTQEDEEVRADSKLFEKIKELVRKYEGGRDE